MKEQLELILRQGLEEISSAARRDELENARVKYLGKKGELTAVLKMSWPTKSGPSWRPPSNRPRNGCMRPP